MEVFASGLASGAEAACAFGWLVEVWDDCESGLNDGEDEQLSDAIKRLDGVWLLVFIGGGVWAKPCADEDFLLIVAVEYADGVAENETVFVAKAGPWCDHSKDIGVLEVDREACGDEDRCLIGVDGEGSGDASTEVAACGAWSGVLKGGGGVGGGEECLQKGVDDF